MGGDTSEIWRYPTHTLRKGRHENYLIGKCDSDGFTSSAAVQCPHVAVEGAQGKSILTVLTRCSSARRPYDTGGKKQGWHLAGNHGATKVPVCHSNRGASKIEPDGEESGLLKLPPPLTGPLNHCRLPPVEKWPPLGMRFFCLLGVPL